jgi:DNA polymerase-3 subunit gamma/tau
VDVLEIDGASNNGVDSVREIRENAKFLPSSGTRKIYIIDEVHQITSDAFNALLKTLEEPPSHVIFILATTEAHKVFDTISSRTETYVFKKPTVEILKQAVLNVCKKEGFEVDQQTAEMLAILGDGSFRDTLGNVQKVISISKDKKISYDEAVLVTGAPKIEVVNDFVKNLALGDLKNSLKALEKAKSSGVDPLVFCRVEVDKFRSILLLRFGQEDFIKENLSASDLDFIKSIEGDKKVKVNSKTIDRLLLAYTQIPRSFAEFLPMELAVVDMLGE